jgi:predicted extracellular nuclease
MKEPIKAQAKRTPAPVPGGDPRGQPDLVVCSQNLKLFGSFGVLNLTRSTYSKSEHQAKVRDLAARFSSVNCDVIAVQEVMAKTAAEGEVVLAELAGELRKRTNRFFKAVVAPPKEGQMTTGFLIASDRATVLQSVPYGRVELPRISKKQRPRLFSRPPLELQLSVRSRESDSVKIVSLVNFHFKSKRGAKDDPSGMEWETYRMEMSEALRQIVESRHKDAFASGESILMLLGDRNSNFDVASARILEGTLSLSSFGEKGPCRMSKRGLPLCQADTDFPRKLFSVISSNKTLQSYPGTFAYKGEYSWLDDILMPAESLRYAWRTAYSEGDFSSGIVSTPKDASDHSMVYVKLNW